MDRSTASGTGVSTVSVMRVRSPSAWNSWVCRHGTTQRSGAETSSSTNRSGGA